jgi:hypothetical protein
MYKIITATAFCAAIEVDNSGKIISTPRALSNFLNLPLTQLETSLKKSKFQSFKIENVEE